MEKHDLLKKPKWMTDEDDREAMEVQTIRDRIAASDGIMSPEENTRSLGWMAHHYSKITERLGRAKAMRDEYFAKLLEENPDLAIGRADAFARGSEFGQMTTYYEQIAAGHLEVIQTLKKVNEYWVNTAVNRY